MEENSSSQMGRFCRQWQLKIRICCHDSDYLSDSGILTLNPTYMEYVAVVPQPLLSEFCFHNYLRVVLCFKTRGKEMPEPINQANNQLKSSRICNSAETQTSVMNKNYEISKGWQVYLMCLSWLLTCGFYFRVCLLGRDGGGGWPKHGGTGRFSFSSQEHCSSLLAS